MQTFFRFLILVAAMFCVNIRALAEDELAGGDLHVAVEALRAAVMEIQTQMPGSGNLEVILEELDGIERSSSADDVSTALSIIDGNLLRLARKTDELDEMIESIGYAYSARIRSVEARAGVLESRVDGLKDRTLDLEGRTDDLEAADAARAQSFAGLEGRVDLLEGRQGRLWFLMGAGSGYVWGGGVISAGAGLAYERGQFYADVLSSFRMRPGSDEFDIRMGSRMGFMLPQAANRVALGVSPEIGLSSDAMLKVGLGGFVKVTVWRGKPSSGRVDAAFDLGAALGVVLAMSQANDDPSKLGFAEGFATLRIGSRTSVK